MLEFRVYAALIALLMFFTIGIDSATAEINSAKADVDQESNKQITQGGLHPASFYKEGYDRDKNIVRKITGPMSDSRKMGIGALLVIIGSILYAGFNWNDKTDF